MINNISIIGGGIGGLTTALAFDKLNISYKLYERASVIKEVGAGIWLSPNALQVFEWIHPELLRAILDSGNPLDRIMIADHKLNPISNSKQSFVLEKFGYTTTAIHRGTLQKILYEYANKDFIELDKTINSYNINEDDTLTVQFTDNTSVLTRSIIGADGINSKVRKQVFPNSQLRYSGQTCWRGVSDYTIEPEFNTTGFTLWGEKLQFGVSKISDGKIYWFAVKLSEQNLKDDKNTIKEVLTNMFRKFHPLVINLITNTPKDKIIRSDLSDLELLDKWYDGNICLIGDAAHSMTPDLGQGGAQAIEDAFYLSNFINESVDILSAFETFCKYRKKKVVKLVKQSRRTSKMAITNKFGEVVRNLALKNIPKRYMQKQMIELYGLKDKWFNN